jgi:hypothetical protein|tara:strand:+ start:161 stop:328 length:168 start_codon:yes stop_codon:yes gene_type:complete
MFKLFAQFLGAVDTDAAPKPTRRQRAIEAYLSESVDRCDLERRERELERKGAYMR